MSLEWNKAEYNKEFYLGWALKTPKDKQENGWARTEFILSHGRRWSLNNIIWRFSNDNHFWLRLEFLKEYEKFSWMSSGVYDTSIDQ